MKEIISLLPKEIINENITSLFPKDSILLNFDKTLYEDKNKYNNMSLEQYNNYIKRINQECDIFYNNFETIYNNISNFRYKNMLVYRINIGYNNNIDFDNNTVEIIKMSSIGLICGLLELHKKYYTLMINQIKTISDEFFSFDIDINKTIKDIKNQKQSHSSDLMKCFTLYSFSLLYVNKSVYNKIVYNISNNKDKRRNCWLLYNEYINNNIIDDNIDLLYTITSMNSVINEIGLSKPFLLPPNIVEKAIELTNLVKEFHTTKKINISIEEAIYLWLSVIELSLKLYGKEKM